ncbi:acetyl-CoA carboxylase biotin carboxyl carrier protein [Methylocapsa polymorpha]|uniref:Biotin carboxyl carrier protein of acetyl-CoA carboxylase n=1 Tax=Methylocapsa polymorpha TaxID=3080828 RepID=A0ABZ0HTX8_9HYPH|nr:acetyl-CoA carboxylase biotin carboxyl carrier protein [Methylocapsa sp. RX1]
MKYPGPKPAGNNAASPIDTDLVETLAKMVTRLGLSEIEVAHGDLKIRIGRQVSAAAIQHVAPPPSPASVSAPQLASAAAPEAPGAVKSPMVGTAYLRSAPDSAPFVEIGSRVRVGDKLLLVEAMKTFNEIVAPRAGTVTGILVEDGQPVEYGQPLLVIE